MSEDFYETRPHIPSADEVRQFSGAEVAPEAWIILLLAGQCAEDLVAPPRWRASGPFSTHDRQELKVLTRHTNSTGRTIDTRRPVDRARALVERHRRAIIGVAESLRQLQTIDLTQVR